MRRRDFIAGLGGAAAAWPRAARAQQRMPAVGFIGLGTPRPNADFVVAFRQGLTEAGYTEGQTVAIEYLWRNRQSAPMRPFAAELLRHNVSAIAVFGITAVLASIAA